MFNWISKLIGGHKHKWHYTSPSLSIPTVKYCVGVGYCSKRA